MARRIFPSFHWGRDIFRANVVRNSWVTRGYENAGFVDNASWESVKRGGDAAIKQWIELQLMGTSVTVVLIGAETASRKYVRYEIERSRALGKGLVGVRIHLISSLLSGPDPPGPNPFDSLSTDGTVLSSRPLSSLYMTYDYVADNGYANLGAWVEAAAQAAGR